MCLLSCKAFQCLGGIPRPQNHLVSSYSAFLCERNSCASFLRSLFEFRDDTRVRESKLLIARGSSSLSLKVASPLQIIPHQGPALWVQKSLSEKDTGENHKVVWLGPVSVSSDSVSFPSLIVAIRNSGIGFLLRRRRSIGVLTVSPESAPSQRPVLTSSLNSNHWSPLRTLAT
jgi:hypothetical protein